jgi:hypothetical protein
MFCGNLARVNATKKTTTKKTTAATGATTKRIARKIGVKKTAAKAPAVKKPSAQKAAAMSNLARRITAKKAAPGGPGASAEVFAKLRAVLAAHAKGLVVKTDTADGYYVVGPKPYKGKELFFGAVRAGKAYVSYHLFPLYMNPKLLARVTPALARRMQGKSCFNFKEVDEGLFAQVGALTESGRRDFEAKDLI